MRAYMSDPTLSESMRGYERDVHHMGAPDYIMAEREARAILADVEDRAQGMAGHRPLRGDMGAAGCALRDMLAAFVGEGS